MMMHGEEEEQERKDEKQTNRKVGQVSHSLTSSSREIRRAERCV